MSTHRLPRIFAPLHQSTTPQTIEIELTSYLQIPGFQIVGLANTEIAESRERIRAAFETLGIEFPKRRIIANLRPASLPKIGASIDLALGASVLVECLRIEMNEDPDPRSLPSEASGAVCAPRWMLSGELSLSGAVLPLGRAYRIAGAALRGGFDRIWVSEADRPGVERALQQCIRASRESTLGLPEHLPIVSVAHTILDIDRDIRSIPNENRSQSHAKKNVKDSVANRHGSPDPAHATWVSRETTSDDLPCEKSAPPRLHEIRHLLPLSASLERVVGACVSGALHLLLLGPRGSGKSHSLEWIHALTPPPSL